MNDHFFYDFYNDQILDLFKENVKNISSQDSIKRSAQDLNKRSTSVQSKETHLTKPTNKLINGIFNYVFSHEKTKNTHNTKPNPNNLFLSNYPESFNSVYNIFLSNNINSFDILLLAYDKTSLGILEAFLHHMNHTHNKYNQMIVYSYQLWKKSVMFNCGNDSVYNLVVVDGTSSASGAYKNFFRLYNLSLCYILFALYVLANGGTLIIKMQLFRTMTEAQILRLIDDNFESYSFEIDLSFCSGSGSGSGSCSDSCSSYPPNQNFYIVCRNFKKVIFEERKIFLIDMMHDSLKFDKGKFIFNMNLKPDESHLTKYYEFIKKNRPTSNEYDMKKHAANMLIKQVNNFIQVSSLKLSPPPNPKVHTLNKINYLNQLKINSDISYSYGKKFHTLTKKFNEYYNFINQRMIPLNATKYEADTLRNMYGIKKVNALWFDLYELLCETPELFNLSKTQIQNKTPELFYLSGTQMKKTNTINIVQYYGHHKVTVQSVFNQFQYTFLNSVLIKHQQFPKDNTGSQSYRMKNPNIIIITESNLSYPIDPFVSASTYSEYDLLVALIDVFECGMFGTNLIAKLCFSCSPFIISLLYILSNVFDKVKIKQSLRDDPPSIYIIMLNYLGCKGQIIDFLKKILDNFSPNTYLFTLFENNYISSLESIYETLTNNYLILFENHLYHYHALNYTLLNAEKKFITNTWLKKYPLRCMEKLIKL
jgi:hypothetical protein